MHNSAPTVIFMAIIIAVAGVCIFGLSKIKNPSAHARWHLRFSLLPFLHLLCSYAVAFYVRIGFGSWPRSCIDNPDLPFLGALLKKEQDLAALKEFFTSSGSRSRWRPGAR